MVARSRSPSPEQDVEPAVTKTSPTNIVTRKCNGNVYQFPADKPLYSAHGKWAWANGYEIVSGDKGTRLGDGLEGFVNLKVGMINEREIVYISKMTSVWDSFRMLFSSLYLNASSKYLRPLQGDCVPWIIGVHHCLGGRIGVAQDLPHPTGWREADMFLEESQKEAIIAAYQKLHDRGILHGDAEYRHMLIGDDGNVTIIDFGLSLVLNPDEWARKAGLDGCSRWCLRNEMRKVKFLLNWKDSRETEFRLTKLRSAREERDRATADAILENKKDPFERVKIPKEPLSEEEKENPDGGIRPFDLNQWSYGDTWVAHRYEVDRSAYSAKLKKTAIPRPPVPAQNTTESTDPVASVVPATGDPVPVPAPAPAIHITSIVSAGATDAPTTTVSLPGKRPLEVEAVKDPETEQTNVNGEGTRAVPLRHGIASENDSLVEKLPLENEPEQELKKAERTMAAPLRHGKAGDSDGSFCSFSESFPKNGQNEQNDVNPERTNSIPLKPGKVGEINRDLPARKRPFEAEPEKEAEEQDDKAKLRKTVPLRHGRADPSSEPARKCSLEVGTEVPEENSNFNRTKVVPLRHDNSDDIQPARKRQRTTEASVAPTLNRCSAMSSMKQLLASLDSQLDNSSTSSESAAGDSMSPDTSSESDADDTMKIPLLDDDAADPTSYELNPEACAFLRGEAARGLARFTTAKTRVLPLETQLNLENHNLEKRRSELLRIMLMLPREDRTTLWTNMGQPDARTLLGLLPETPGSSQSTRNLIRVQTHLARNEAASRGNNSNGSMSLRESDPGFLAVQKARAKTSVKQKLHQRLDMKRRMNSLAMPPPPLPVVLVKKSVSGEVENPKSSSYTSNSSPRKASREGGTSQSLPSTLQGASQSGSTRAVQPAITPHMHYESLKALIDPPKAKANGISSGCVPKDILALESKSTRSEGPSNSSGSGLVRTAAAFYNLELMENATLGAIEVESKRKRDLEVADSVSEDGKTMAIAEGGAPDAKRRKTKNCDLL